ncbi:MAG: hypothetical protein U0457_00250 [Candidatus Sericytochromatia bacterium]
MKKIFKLILLFSLISTFSCTPLLRNIAEWDARDYNKKLFTLDIENKKVKIIKREKKNTKYHDLIIFMGVTTFEKSYIPLYPHLKDMNIFVIHTPLHGYDEEMTTGKPIENADDLTNFQVKVVKELIKNKITTSKVNILGYSMGGMTLINILNKNLLDNEIENAILVNTNRSNDAIKDKHNSQLIDKSLLEKKYDANFFLDKCYSDETPFHLKMLGTEAFFATDEASLGDFSCVRDFERVAIEEKIKPINKKTLYIASEKDKIFYFTEAEKFSKNFSNVSFKKLGSGHISLLEKPSDFGNIIMNYLEKQK